ncbi:capsule biosynthesis protein [Paraburkholderia sp. BR14263]|uniref:capsule biosynthesis protein n=1 Tax=unclassified Paraburkholderia TaxID=2615204 RepID=UPI0034D0017D
MLPGGWHYFSGKRVLLLQGPVGPFFSKLRAALQEAGASSVDRINLNAGDWLFASGSSINYRGRQRDWSAFLDSVLTELGTEVVMLFGDCRPYHVVACEVARARGVAVWVFEEGYVRPDFVTLERDGTNGHSLLPRDPLFYRSLPERAARAARQTGRTFRYLVLWGALYGVASTAGRVMFPHYRHHRSLDLSEAYCWLRAAWRKLMYRVKERGMLNYLTRQRSKHYFLVSLQTAIDSQIRVHSRFPSMTAFIEEVICSFAQSENTDYQLVFKHHPLDRGHSDYTKAISRLACRYGVQGRVLYLHDQHLPTLLEHAIGLVVVNSTVGLSGIHHALPVKALGKAIYDMEGLTFQGPLDDFWGSAQRSAPDMKLYERYRAFVVEQTQLNGSFYTGQMFDVTRWSDAIGGEGSETPGARAEEAAHL